MVFYFVLLCFFKEKKICAYVKVEGRDPVGKGLLEVLKRAGGTLGVFPENQKGSRLSGIGRGFPLSIRKHLPHPPKDEGKLGG